MTEKKDHSRIVECLKALEIDEHIALSKYSGGQRWPRKNFDNDSAFFYVDSFIVEIAPKGRKYFEELEQRAEQETQEALTKGKSGEHLIFVSCGQSTPAERQLGQAVVKIVEEKTGCSAYFAQNQAKLEGLTENILKKLHQNVIRSESRAWEICLAKTPTRLFDNIGFHNSLLFLLLKRWFFRAVGQ